MDKKEFLQAFILEALRSRRTYSEVKTGHPIQTFEGLADARVNEALAVWDALERKLMPLV